MKKFTYYFDAKPFSAFLSAITEQVKAINYPIDDTKGIPKLSKYNRVEIHVKGSGTDKDESNVFGSNYLVIPDNNYYLKCFYQDELKRVVNLYHDADGKFKANGRLPIFIFEKDIGLGLVSGNVKLLSAAQMMRLTIYDKLSQIAFSCSRDTQAARWNLIDNACVNILKFRELGKSNTVNHAIKIASRFVFIPKNVDGSNNLINEGNWTFNAQTNPHGSLTDCFDQSRLKPDSMKKLFDSIGLRLDTGSESSGMKGVLVENTPAIHQAKIQYNRPYELELADIDHKHHDDILIQDVKDINGELTGDKRSMYLDPQKNFAREKSLSLANLAQFPENKQEIVGDGYSFWRHYCYLNRNPDLIGKEDSISLATTFNLIVAFVEGSDQVMDLLGVSGKMNSDLTDDDKKLMCKNFENIDKSLLSAQLNTADCHARISQEVASQTAILERAMTFLNPEASFTEAFHEILNALKKGPYEITKDTSINLDTHLAYEVKCVASDDHMMVPVKIVDIEGDVAYIPLAKAQEGHEHWFCNCCKQYTNFIKTESYLKNQTGRMFEDSSIRPVTINTYYTNVQSVLCREIDMEIAEDSGVVMRLDLRLLTDIVRAVSPDGLKAETIPVSRGSLGVINAEFIHPVTKERIVIKNQPVDMVIPNGAFKGKNTGMTIAFSRYLNAMLGLKLCPDEAEFTGTEEYESLVNSLYDTASITYTRFDYNFKTNNFEEIVQTNISPSKVRIGMVNFGVTEINSEFFKILTKHNPMKVSPMNSIAYNLMGFQELDSALRQTSESSLQNPENFDKFEQLIRCYKANPYLQLPVLDPTKKDIRKAPQIMLSQVLLKADWLKFISQHQLWTDQNLKEGLSIKVMTDKGVEVSIVIPSRKLLNTMINSSTNQRVILSDCMLKIVELWHTVALGNTVRFSHILKYRESILKLLRGKHGILAKSATYLAEGVQGKSIASGFIPTSTMVIGNKRFWKNIHRNSAYQYLEYDDFIRRLALPNEQSESIQFFGTSQRDPFIWFDQGMNVVEVWHPRKFDRYLRERYNIIMFDLFPMLNSDTSTAIITNVLDALFLFQEDSDGDLKRVLMPQSSHLQSLLREANAKFKNYKHFFNKEVETMRIINDRTVWWHLRYILKEVEGNNVTDLESYPGVYKIVTQVHVPSAINNAYLNAISAKTSIGTITFSQWNIQQVANLVYNTGLITYEQYISACLFYQTIITQGGCIQSVKHVSGALNSLTIDEIAKNVKAVEIKNEFNETVTRLKPLDKIKELIITEGYGESTVKAFETIIDFWIAHSQVIEGKSKPMYATPQGLMVKAASAFFYGSSGGLMANQDLFKALECDDIKKTMLYQIHGDFINVITSIEDKLYSYIINPQIENKDKI